MGNGNAVRVLRALRGLVVCAVLLPALAACVAGCGGSAGPMITFDTMSHPMPDVVEVASPDFVVADAGRDAGPDVLGDPGADDDGTEAGLDASADAPDPAEVGTACLVPEDCDDGDPCVLATCDVTTGHCLYVPLSCDDGNACTVDACDLVAGCRSDPIVCDDGDPSTLDGCVASTGCVFTPVVCDDGDACTLDRSDGSAGCVHEPRDCGDGDACTTDVCDPASGCANVAITCDDANPYSVDECDPSEGCVFTPVECDDGDACTVDRFDAGSGCVHLPRDCGDGDACTADGCDPASGCANVAITCDDADPFTVDECDPSAGCLFTPVECDDGDACTVDRFDAGTGCTHQPRDCGDKDACTADACDRESGCVRVPVDCDDGNACTADTCHPATGCVHAPVACDDGSACTTDFCDPAAGCVYTPIVCDDASACTTDFCDLAAGCVYTPIACDDGNACTTESCDPATGCVQAPVDCDDDSVCTGDSCNPATGCVHEVANCDDADASTVDECDPLAGCVHTPIACDDGNACTTDRHDAAAGCSHVPLDCDDGSACTTDTCDPATGCVFTAVACDDGDACTRDACDPATGCASTAIVCDDKSACTIDACDSATGCVFTAITCDDGSACTTDTCDPAVGCVRAPVVCDDGSRCTTDSCNASTGCVYAPITCEDGSACTTDSCNPAKGCVHLPVACDDQDLCTTDACDPVTGCIHAPVTCDDGNEFTSDQCDPAAGCVHAPIECDDGNACTTERWEAATGCSHVAIDCADNSACTVDTCDPARGCVRTPVACADGNACTTDACDPVVGCMFTPIACSDGSACTTDACNPSTGCVYAPITCDDSSKCTTDSCNASTGCVFTPITCDDSSKCTTDACVPATGCIYTPVPETCGNGLDDDCDGKADCLDPDCASACLGEVCSNGTDDDGDKLADCADPDCKTHLACAGDSCDNPWLIPGTALVDVDTRHLTPGFPVGCAPVDGTDAVFKLVVAAPSDVHVSTLESDFDTALSIRGTTCTTPAYLACNNDVGPTLAASRLEIAALPAGTWFLRVSDATGGPGGHLRLNVVVTPSVAAVWPATTQDPLVRMPGTQPGQGVTMETPESCNNCHGNYDPAVEPNRAWRGSMMAQASRDFQFWASMAVAIQDSLWALGTPNAADLCERCHFPQGWVEGRSDPPNAAAMTGYDYDGVHCDVCHSMYDPHFEDTFAGTREGSDWIGYWDESGKSATSSATAAAATRAADRTVSAQAKFFNGQAYFGADFRPVPPAWNENASGQYFLEGGKAKRASFADAGAKHPMHYSRYHKSRNYCATCHDVTNPALANLDHAGTPPGAGAPQLPSETRPAWDLTHVERTFSEFSLSAFGAAGGAPGAGAFAPASFKTSHPGNNVASCQDCHMRDLRGVACNKTSGIFRHDNSVEHPKSGLPDHSMAGGNPFVLKVLASTVAGSANYDAVNAGLLNGKAATLTLDLLQGSRVDPVLALEGADKAVAMLQAAASIQGLTYSAATGQATFRVVNHTGHKLLSGFPEGRRAFVNVRAWKGTSLVAEINPYDATVGTLKGLPLDESPASPPLQANESRIDDLVYECRMGSTLTGEDHTFHFVLSTHRYKDNRVPPRGFRIAEAAARKAEPVALGETAPGRFTAAEYAGGYDDVVVTLPAGATRVEVTLYYQATSREYVEFLRDQINGTAATLTSPTPAGGALTYTAGDLSFFDALRAWGDTIWQLWEHNRNVPGAAPVPMAQAVLGS